MNYSAMNETEIAALNISSVYVGCYNQANGGKSAAGNLHCIYIYIYIYIYRRRVSFSHR